MPRSTVVKRLIDALREQEARLESRGTLPEDLHEAEEAVMEALHDFYRPTHDSLSDFERRQIQGWRQGLTRGYSEKLFPDDLEIAHDNIADLMGREDVGPLHDYLADSAVLDEIVRRAPRLPVDMRVWRGVPEERYGRSRHAPTDNQRVLSTSVSEGVSRNFGSRPRRYDVPQGSPALPLPDDASVMDVELEMLLPIRKRGRDNFLLYDPDRGHYYYIPPYKARGGAIRGAASEGVDALVDLIYS